MADNRWLFTENPVIQFENSAVGRVKKEVWDASREEIDRILKEDFEIPSESELTKANCYIQTTPRHLLKEKRRKNDIVLVPIGCTENHGDHCSSGHDTFQVTQFLEGVRRYTAKQGKEVNLAFPALLYGGHPYHHIGMPGTIILCWGCGKMALERLFWLIIMDIFGTLLQPFRSSVKDTSFPESIRYLTGIGLQGNSFIRITENLTAWKLTLFMGAKVKHHWAFSCSLN